MAEEVAARIKLSGEQEFREALRSIGAELKVNQSQLQLVAAQYSKNSESLDAYRSRSDALKDSISSQKDKIEILKQGLSIAAEKYGEASTRTQELQAQTNKAQTELLKMTAALEKEQQGAKNSAENTGKAAKEFEKIPEEANKSSRSIDTLTVAFGNLVARGIEKAISALADFIGTGVEMASDLQEVQNVVDVTFGPAGSQKIEQWSKTTLDAFGLSELKAKQYSSTLGAMMASADITGDELETMAMKLTETTADFASFYNLDHDTAYQKIQSGLAGQVEPLRSLGISLTAANINASDFAESLGKTYDEMTESEKVMARYEYILQAGSNAMGDFARTSESFANQKNLWTSNLQEIGVAIGEKLIPRLAQGLETMNTFVKENTGLFSQLGDVLGTIFGIMMDGAENALPSVVAGLNNFSKFLKENSGAIENIGGIISKLVSVFGMLISVIASLPPEMTVVLVLVAGAIKLFIEGSKSVNAISGALKLFGSATDSTVIKLIAFAGILAAVLYLILAIKEGTDRAARSMAQMGNSMNIPKMPAYAKGTTNAKSGLALVGEEGPELVNFRGGEAVYTASRTASLLNNVGSSDSNNSKSTGNQGNVENHYHYNINGIEEFRQIQELIESQQRRERAAGRG